MMPSSDDRHPWLDEMCGLLEAVLAGREASGLLDAGEPSAPGRAALVSLPMWIWRPPNLDVGRKALSSDGGRLSLPIRVRWATGPVRLLPPGEHRLRWAASGMGHDLRGAVVLEAVGSPVGTPVVSMPDADGRTRVGLISRRAAVSGLKKLVEQGEMARWQASSLIEPRLSRALAKAHVAVGADLRDDGEQILTPVDLEIVRDRLLWGEIGDGPSHVDRLVTRCLDPGVFAAVDPLRYIAMSLRRDAEEAIRRHVGDPRIGAKIRRVHAELDRPDLHELIAHYKTHFPGDHLGRKRAEAALEMLERPPAAPLPLLGPSARHPTASGRRRPA